MSLIHTIRLRGPWELTPLLFTDSASREMLPRGEPRCFAGEVISAGETITQQLPAAWDAVLPGFRGTVRYTRRFGKPTNLEAHERVWMVVSDVAGSATMQLNSKEFRCEKVSGTFFDMTDQLRERNLLQIDVTQTDPEKPAGLVGEVRLEIRVADSLRESEPV